MPCVCGGAAAAVPPPPPEDAASTAGLGLQRCCSHQISSRGIKQSTLQEFLGENKKECIKNKQSQKAAMSFRVNTRRMSKRQYSRISCKLNSEEVSE